MSDLARFEEFLDALVGGLASCDGHRLVGDGKQFVGEGVVVLLCPSWHLGINLMLRVN